MVDPRQITSALSTATAEVRRRLADDLATRLVLERYRAIDRLRASLGGGSWFTTRMLGRPALVVSGESGVRTFYDAAIVARKGAVPAPVRMVLFGPGAVHGLDDEPHASRKHLLLRCVDTTSVARLTDGVGRRLDDASRQWDGAAAVDLFDELVEIYGTGALEWAGTGVTGTRARDLSHELAAIVDGFGVGGTPYPRAVLARLRTQRWATGLVRAVRAGRIHPPEDTAVATLAAAPDLPDLVAGTELLNLVRPTVAVAYFGAYAAQALLERPDWRAPLAAGSRQHLRAFEHEIRRWYPFTPLLTGRLREPYPWQGRELPAGSWIVLDVRGTNRDPSLWERPDAFLPERFLDREPTPYDYVPHGGGHPAAGHRCPGEPMAVGILEATLQRLAGLDFALPPESRSVPLRRIPSLPEHGVTLLEVRATAPA